MAKISSDFHERDMPAIDFLNVLHILGVLFVVMCHSCNTYSCVISWKFHFESMEKSNDIFLKFIEFDHYSF